MAALSLEQVIATLSYDSWERAKYLDLTASQRFQGSKLLEQCVKPSAEIHKEYQTQQILLDDGLLTGLVVEETDEQIRLVPNLLKPDKFTTINKGSIEHAAEYWHACGLLDTFNIEEILISSLSCNHAMV